MGSFRGALCKISDVNNFKRLLLPQFSSNFNQTLQKTCIQGKYRLLLILAICQTLKVYIWHFENNLPQLYTASIHKAMLVSSGKGLQSVKAPGPLVFIAPVYVGPDFLPTWRDSMVWTRSSWGPVPPSWGFDSWPAYHRGGVHTCRIIWYHCLYHLHCLSKYHTMI